MLKKRVIRNNKVTVLKAQGYCMQMRRLFQFTHSWVGKLRNDVAIFGLCKWSVCKQKTRVVCIRLSRIAVIGISSGSCLTSPISLSARSSSFVTIKMTGESSPITTKSHDLYDSTTLRALNQGRGKGFFFMRFLRRTQPPMKTWKPSLGSSQNCQTMNRRTRLVILIEPERIACI